MAYPNWVPVVGGPFAEPLAQVRDWVNFNRSVGSENYGNWLRGVERAQTFEAAANESRRQDARDRFNIALQLAQGAATRADQERAMEMQDRQYETGLKLNREARFDDWARFMASLKAAKERDDLSATLSRESFAAKSAADEDQLRRSAAQYAARRAIDADPEEWLQITSKLDPYTRNALEAERGAFVRQKRDWLRQKESSVDMANRMLTGYLAGSEPTQERIDAWMAKNAKFIQDNLSDAADFDPDNNRFVLRPLPGWITGSSEPEPVGRPLFGSGGFAPVSVPAFGASIVPPTPMPFAPIAAPMGAPAVPEPTPTIRRMVFDPDTGTFH